MLQEFVTKAGTAKEMPPPPPGGIPKQYLPAPIRFLIEISVLPFLWLDMAIHRALKFIIRPPYKRGGSCKQRGNCCYYIHMKKERGLLGVVQKFWATQINGFFLRSKKPLKAGPHEYHILGCRYLKKSGKCGHYTLRPRICRDWPRTNQFEEPAFFKGCGFHAYKRGDKDKTPLNIIE